MNREKLKYLILAPLFLAATLAGGEWQTMPDMPTGRTGACAVVLDGWIYVIGGENGGAPLKTVERFHPDNNAWDKNVAHLREKRANATAVVLDDKIYVIGGHEEDEASGEVERYNPAKNKWEEMEELKIDRILPTAVVFNNKIYVIGGVNEDDEYIKQTEVYDPSDDEWHLAPEMNLQLGRSGAGAFATGGGVFLVGGLYRGPINTIDFYSPGQGWRTVAQLQTARSNAGVVSLGDSLYAVGGDGFSDAVATIEAWSLPQMTLAKEFDMPNPRSGAAVAATDDAIYLFGGKGEERLVERFVPAFNTGVSQKKDENVPSDFLLLSSYPNPFTESTTFRIMRYGNNSMADIHLVIYNVLGQVVADINTQAIGRETSIAWRAVDSRNQPLPPGVYLVRLSDGGHIAQQKIMIGR